MTNEERLQKVIFGTQYSSLKYVERFSMCDCLTLGMENTYTAMGAGLELFLKKFFPGEKYVMPYAGKIPKDKEVQFRPVGYKIPEKIRTFLWSPFHDSTSTYWGMNDGVRFAFRFRGAYLRDFGIANKLPKPPLYRVKEHIIEMDKKITDMWGEKINKIIIFYDNSRLREGPAKERMRKFRKITQEALDWPIVQVKLTHHDAMNKEDATGIKRWSGWEHYSPYTRKQLLNNIKSLEKY